MRSHLQEPPDQGRSLVPAAALVYLAALCGLDDATHEAERQKLALTSGGADVVVDGRRAIAP